MPFLKGKLNEDVAKKRIKELEDLYSEMLRGLSKIVRKDCAMVMPVFKIGNKLLRINLRKLIESTNFKVKRGPLLYKGHKSRLLREIWVFGKDFR